MTTKHQLWFSSLISVVLHIVVLFLSFSLEENNKEKKEYKALHVSLGDDGEIGFFSEGNFSSPLSFQNEKVVAPKNEEISFEEEEGLSKAQKKQEAQLPSVPVQANPVPKPVNKARPVKKGVRVGNSSSGIHHLSYEQLLPLWLERFKKNPKGANGKYLKGRGVVFLTVNRQGRILLYKVKRSTGISELDRALIQMIKDANPAIPFPEEYRVEDKTVSYEIEFRF